MEMKELQFWFRQNAGKPLATAEGDGKPFVQMAAGINDNGVFWWIPLSEFDQIHAVKIESFKVHNSVVVEINGIFVAPVDEWPTLEEVNGAALVAAARAARDPLFLEALEEKTAALTG